MHTDSWRGEIRGVAIYDTVLSRTQIVAHYEAWKHEARKDHDRRTVTRADNIAALCLMDECGGNTIHSGTNLE